jgi:outer membrane protein assembly factor BamB
MYFQPSDDFDMELEDIEIRKTRKFDRVFRIGFGGSIDQKPALVNGIIYFGSLDHNVYAVDAETGKEVWRFKANGPIMESSPVISENVMYIGSFDNNLYAIDIGNGEEMWRFRTGGEIYNVYPGIVYKGMVFVPSFDNFIYVLDAGTGKETWRFRAGKYGLASAPYIHDEVIYQNSREGILFALDTEGKELWRFKSEMIIAVPNVYKNRIYVGAGDRNLYCLNLEGKELWRFKSDGEVYWYPVVWKDRVYFTSWDCHLYCIDADTGKEVWRFATSTLSQSSMPPPFESYEAVIKKTVEESEEGEEKYSVDVSAGETIGSEYGIKSEYQFKSEYRQEGEYK